MTDTAKRADLPAVISQRERSEVVPLDRQHAPTVPAVPSVSSILEGMETAVAKMNADDVSVEMDVSTEGGKSTAKFRLRAYRHRKPVVDIGK